MKTIYIPNTTTSAYLHVRPETVLAQITKQTGLPARATTRVFKRVCDGETHEVRVIELAGDLPDEQQLRALSNYPFASIAYWWENDDGDVVHQAQNESEWEARRDSAQRAVLFLQELIILVNGGYDGRGVYETEGGWWR
jgi:hypothetical protein